MRHSTTTKITLHGCRLKQKPQRASKSDQILKESL
jgi:hypothetical protein